MGRRGPARPHRRVSDTSFQGFAGESLPPTSTDREVLGLVLLQPVSPPAAAAFVPCHTCLFCRLYLLQTVEVLGLVLANPAPPLPAGAQRDEKGYIKTRWGSGW